VAASFFRPRPRSNAHLDSSSSRSGAHKVKSKSVLTGEERLPVDRTGWTSSQADPAKPEKKEDKASGRRASASRRGDAPLSGSLSTSSLLASGSSGTNSLLDSNPFTSSDATAALAELMEPAAPPLPVKKESSSSSGVSPLSKRGSMILKKNKMSKQSTSKLKSSIYSKKQITAAMRIQKWYRMRRLLSAIETAVFFNKRRRAVLREIYSTEESYMASLTVLNAQFMDQLKLFFSEAELMDVFAGVRELLTLHRDFFNQLRNQVPGVGNKEATAVNTQVAHLFLSFAPQFEDVYTKFLTNQDKSRRTVEVACARSKDLVQAMDKITDRNGSQRGRQFFDSLMTGPMQRLPRYQLLLREYQKNTNPMYGDVREIGDALQSIAHVTLVVNENKRDHDELHMREMLEINSSMEVLETHTFETMTFSAARNCAHCEKAIWGLTKSGVRCTECSSCFHTHCHKPIVMQRLCPRRKKLDFSTKKLTYLQEVLVIPFNPDLHVAASASATPTVSFKDFRESTGNGTNGVANVGVPAVTPSQKRLAKPLRRSKAVLCFFDDGLGIAHIRSDDQGADKFDFMGDLPWAILDECFAVEAKERDDEWVFAVKARFQEWRFALPTKTEQEAIVAKLNEERKTGTSAMRKRAQSIGSSHTPSLIKKSQ
jgi:hypothetical protein